MAVTMRGRTLQAAPDTRAQNDREANAIRRRPQLDLKHTGTPGNLIRRSTSNSIPAAGSSPTVGAIWQAHREVVIG
jgi:hypothetical protein